MFYNDALRYFLDDCRVRNLSDKTIEGYDQSLNFFGQFLPPDVAQFDYAVYQSFVLQIRERKLSAATVSSYCRTFKVFIRYCEKEGFIVVPFSQRISVPKSPRRIVHIYTDDELRQIFDLFDLSDWVSLRDRALVALMLDSGLRMEETTLILMADFMNDKLLVHGKGAKDRIVPLGSFSLSCIRRYILACPFQLSDSLFVTRRGLPLTKNAVKLFIHKLALKLPFKFSAHRLRHNFATNYCLDSYRRTGHVDIYSLMVLMGHADVETTRRYLHIAASIIASESHISHLDGLFNFQGSQKKAP